jgi:hypothetical protein
MTSGAEGTNRDRGEAEPEAGSTHRDWPEPAGRTQPSGTGTPPLPPAHWSSAWTPVLAVGLACAIGAAFFVANAGNDTPAASPTASTSLIAAGAGTESPTVLQPTPGPMPTATLVPTPDCTITMLGPWQPNSSGGPRDFDVDATAANTTTILHIWIPSVTAAHVEYDIWLTGTRESFRGAGVAWQYVDCNGTFISSDVAADEGRRRAEGTTVIPISLADFRSQFPESEPT